MKKKQWNASATAVVVLLSVLLVLPCFALPVQQVRGDKEDVIKLKADLVELFLTVKDGSRFIKGLKAGDFEVYEDGIAQELTYFDNEDQPVSVALLLDTSGSMQKAIGMLQQSAIKFIDSLKSDDEVAIISFGGMIRELAPFGRDKNKLAEAIGQTYADGPTLLYDGITRALIKLEFAGGRKAIVLITDGADTSSQLSAETVVKMSGRMAVPLFLVGAGDALKENKLKDILESLAERTGGNAYFIKSIKDLAQAFSEISANLKTSYRAGYYLSRAADGKWHKISVRLKNAKGQVISRQGYYARAKIEN